MRRIGILTITLAMMALHAQDSCAQSSVLGNINAYGNFDRWSTRTVKESAILGGGTKTLTEFYGNYSNIETSEPFKAPAGYLWRTNNVVAVVAGITKASATSFAEKRGDGYCARIETQLETMKAAGIVNLEVTCQGGISIGSLSEPIRDTKNPMAKVHYGVKYTGPKPVALVYDYKADVGHEIIKATGMGKAKAMGERDYPKVTILLQNRWEDADGKMHALRVGTGIEQIRKSTSSWVNGHSLEVRYGDISGTPGFMPYMDLVGSGPLCMHAINSKGRDVEVPEEGWASDGTQANYLIIIFSSSSGAPFCGGVGNVLWIDNVKVVTEN